MANTFTGYTHFWHKPDALPLRNVLMASVETPEARAQAKALGWRTFRMRTEGAPIQEAQCPYPTIGLQCIRCGACDGRRRGLRGDITEVVHGFLAGGSVLVGPARRRNSRPDPLQNRRNVLNPI